MRVIAGVGMRLECGTDEIVALVRRAGGAAGREVEALAAPSFKRAQAADAAAALSVPLLLVGADALAAVQDLCVTRSAVAARAVGVASVAEGSALAAAGPGGRLILARIAGARATCALAEAP